MPARGHGMAEGWAANGEVMADSSKAAELSYEASVRSEIPLGIGNGTEREEEEEVSRRAWHRQPERLQRSWLGSVVVRSFADFVLGAARPPGFDPGSVVIGSELDLEPPGFGLDRDFESGVRGCPEDLHAGGRERDGG